MDQAAGWVIYEDFGGEFPSRRLLSILPAHRSYAAIARVMEQMYAERFASMDEEAARSGKRPKRPRFMAQKDSLEGAIYVGHSPVYVGAYAHRFRVRDASVEFWYRIPVARHRHQPVFEDRHQVVPIRWGPTG